MGPRRNVLCLNSPKHGQAIVHLAVAHGVAFRNKDFHIDTLAPLEARVRELEEHVSRSSQNSGTITFHAVDGLPMIATPVARSSVPNLICGPGTSSAVTKYRLFTKRIST